MKKFSVVVLFLLSLSFLANAKRFPVHYSISLAPDCLATFDGWVDVDMAPWSSHFLDVTHYGGTVTLSGSGCGPGSFPISGIVSGVIPFNGYDRETFELNEIGTNYFDSAINEP